MVNAAVTVVLKPTARWDDRSQPKERWLASDKDKALDDGAVATLF